jgi:hypothetical protein
MPIGVIVMGDMFLREMAGSTTKMVARADRIHCFRGTT